MWLHDVTPFGCICADHRVYSDATTNQHVTFKDDKNDDDYDDVTQVHKMSEPYCFFWYISNMTLYALYHAALGFSLFSSIPSVIFLKA